MSHLIKNSSNSSDISDNFFILNAANTMRAGVTMVRYLDS